MKALYPNNPFNQPSAIDITVKGTVINTSGEPLSGVTVQFKNGTATSTTDAEGKFDIKVPEGSVLVFTYIGYKTLEQKAAKSETTTVVMEPAENSMEEVIVVGYGSQKKLNITGAIDQISGKKLAERPIANLYQGLQGLSPGLNITYGNGTPGSKPNINVRGVATLASGGVEPLIIIDGIAGSSDDILRLNPQDIASMSVLRDAASAAIYGARAAFGVILITTKGGSGASRSRISYNNYFAWSRPTVVPTPVTDPYIFMRVLETSTDNTPWDYVNFAADQYQWAKERSQDPSVENVRIQPGTQLYDYMGNSNQIDYFMSKASPSQNHSLSFSGGAELGKGRPFGYLLSADWTSEAGLNKIAKDEWNRYGLRAKINFTPLNWLKVENNLNVYQYGRSSPSYALTDIYYSTPLSVPKNPDGTWAYYTRNDQGNGAGIMGSRFEHGGREEYTVFGFQNIMRGIASFLNNDLQITGSASFKRENQDYSRYYLKYPIGVGPGDVRLFGDEGSLRLRDYLTKHDVMDLFVTYNKNLGVDHAIKLLAGYNQESFETGNSQIDRSRFISSALPYLSLATAPPTVSAAYTTYALRSYFGRINYSFKNRYIIEVNARRDGSSRFPKERRWGNYPSVSVAWVAHEESFMAGISNVITNLKFRSSYGSLGNQQVRDFSYIQTLPIRTSPYIINGVLPTVAGVAPPLAVDPQTYTWEDIKTFNVGTDIGFAQNRINIGFDYFVRNTIGMLGRAVALPGVMGTPPPLQNAADLRTKGWELSLAYRDEFSVSGKPFSLGGKLFVSDSRTRVTKYENPQQLLHTSSEKNYRVGEEIGEIWGLVNDGFFASQAEIDALNVSAIVPWGALSVIPGWMKYVDLDKDGKIEQGLTATDPKDKKIIGNSMPRYRIGFNLDFAWNNIDASIFIQGVGKQDYYPRHYLFWGPMQQPYAGVYEWNLDFYRGESESGAERDRHSASYIAAGLADANTSSRYPVLQSWLADANNQLGLDIPQTQYLLSAAYLRLKNITIGYTLPQSLTSKIKLNRVRLFAAGENVYEISDLKYFVDPEVASQGYDLSVGQGNGQVYPFQRKFSFGLNIDL